MAMAGGFWGRRAVATDLGPRSLSCGSKTTTESENLRNFASMSRETLATRCHEVPRGVVVGDSRAVGVPVAHNATLGVLDSNWHKLVTISMFLLSVTPYHPLFLCGRRERNGTDRNAKTTNRQTSGSWRRSRQG